MANPQAEDGHVDIANELVEALARVNLSPYESRILWVLWRQTWGWHKKADRISYSQWEKFTGLKRPNICRALKSLVKRNIVTVISTDNRQKQIYTFQKDYSLWVLSPKITTKLLSLPITTVISTDNELLSLETHTKETTKETHKRKGGKQVTPPDHRVTEIMDSLKGLRGYLSPAYGREAKAVKAMLVSGHTPEDILGCWRAMKLEPFHANKELLLDAVVIQLPNWVSGGKDPEQFMKRGGSGNGHKPGAGQLPTDADFEAEREAYHAASG